MRRTVLVLSAFALLLASCGSDTDEGQDAQPTGAPQASASVSTATGSPTASPTAQIRTDYDIPLWSEIVAMYDYDTSEPLDYEVIGKEREKGATVFEIEYQSSGYAVPGYLVIPDGGGPFPAVLFEAHYYDDPWIFVPDAVALAREGYAGLVIQSPAVRPPNVCFDWPCWDAEENIEAYVTAVVEARRGIDVLETLPQIDATRIGFVGHSSGANMGAILAGVEHRIDAYVWVCGDPHITEIARLVEEVSGVGLEEGTERTRWQEGVAALNPQYYVTHAQGTHALVQVWRDSPYCDVGLQTLLEAIPEPKTIEWYDYEECGGSSCDPDVPTAVDHRAWLRENV